MRLFFQRSLVILLILAMTVSSMSFPTFAVDEADQKQDFEELIADSELIAEGTDELQKTDLELRQQIDEQIEIVLTATGAKPEMTDEEITNAVIYMDADEYDAVYAAFDAIEALAAQMTEEQLAAYSEDEDAQTVGRVYSTLEALNTPMLLATIVEVLDGQVSVTDSLGNGKVDGNTVTVTAKGRLLRKETNTITIANETENTAKLSFDYSVASANSFMINDESADSSGTHNQMLEPGGFINITITSNSGFSDLTVTLKLSNFSLTAAAASSSVTINYDSSLGSVTAAGEVVASGTTQKVSLSDGIALVATANSGAKFLGWVDAAN